MNFFLAALVETTRDRAAATESGSTVNVSGGHSTEIFELYTNKLVFSESDPDSPSPH